MGSILHFRYVKLGLFSVIAGAILLSVFTVTSVSAGPIRTVLGTIPAELPNETSNYLSLMQGGEPSPVNGNSRSYADEQDSLAVHLKLYAITNETRTLKLNFVERDVGSERACENFKIKWRFYGLTGDEKSPNGRSGSGESTILGPKSSSCSGRYALISLPSGKMDASTLTNHRDDENALYTGIIELSTETELAPASVGSNRSPTFKALLPASCDTCAKLGYAGEVAGIDPKTPIYPSNLSNGNNVTFFFAPPCDVSTRTDRVKWEDTDRGAVGENQDINSNFVNNVNYTPGSDPVTGRTGKINSIEADVVDAVSGTNVNSGTVTYTGANPGVNFNHTQGHIYKLNFSDVTGGNRIIFDMPYDSGEYHFRCRETKDEGWGLKNSTVANRTVVGVTEPTVPTVPKPTNPTTYYPGIPCSATYNGVNRTRCVSWNTYYAVKTSRTIDALADVRFTHQVGNTNSNGKLYHVTAPSGSGHISNINYHFIRFDGTADPYKPRYNSLDWTDNIAPLAWKYPYAPDSPTTNSTQDMARNILGEPADSTRYGDPQTGDQYCEELKTIPGNSTGGNIDRSYRCITISFDAPTGCSGQPWTIKAYADTQKNSGGGTSAVAWVGDNYGFYYAFGKDGSAEKTATINFRSMNNDAAPAAASVVSTWSQVFTLPLNSGTGEQRRVIAIGPEHGGMTFKSFVDWAPNDGLYDNTTDTICGTPSGSGSIAAPDVTVPFYYHLKAKTTGLPSSMQQGDAIKPNLRVNLPEKDDQDLEGSASDNEFDGRPHTYSKATDWRIIEFKTTDTADAIGKIPRNTSTAGTGDCTEMIGFGIAGFTDCAKVKEGTETFALFENKRPDNTNITMEYARPVATIEPVGTNICYVAVITKPTHNASPNVRYSNVSCTTVVKSPKVQFLNGDLTVGRYREGDGPPLCTPPNAVTPSSVQTTGVPSGFGLLALPGSANLYGSWVEYGAFASGTFSNFGTAAYAKYSGSPSAEEKLMFGNTPSKGSYAFGNNCMSNPFSMINPSNVNDLPPGQASNLRLNQYFTNPDHDTPAEDKTGYVSDQRDITISPPPGPTTYTATVTIKAGAENPNIGPDLACPNMKVTLKEGDGTPAVKDFAVCDNSGGGAPLGTYIHTFDLGSQGYKGPQGLNIIYTNDHCCSGGDRNLYLGEITVKFDTNGSGATVNPFDVDPAKNRRLFNPAAAYTVPSDGGGGFDPDMGGTGSEDGGDGSEPEVDSDGNACYDSPFSAQYANRLFVPQSLDSSSGGGRWCYGYNLEASELGTTAVAPPAGALDDNFNAFKGRDIVLYAKKGPGVCGTGGVNGNIVINTDINYAKAGYSDIRELPRIVLLADCKIIIDDLVKRVDAWLIAKDAVQTCGALTGELFRTNSVSQFTCPEQLRANGPVQAKRLLLWRTHGADLTVGASRSEAAEVFDLRPDQLLATYAKGRDAGKPQTVYQTDLPPRY